VQETISVTAIGVFGALLSRWICVHWRFWSIMCDEESAIPGELSKIACAHARGFGWINFAPEYNYRGLDYE
jgi:hypothetical protein